jgi:hypothetical protein
VSPEETPRKKKRKKRVPRMIDWYRVDTTERIKQVLGVAASLVLLGSLLGAICVGLLRSSSGPARYAMFRTPVLEAAPAENVDLVLGLGVVALMLVVGGGGTAILGLMRELSQERWLALRTDGLVIADAGREKRAPWGKIDDVRVEGTTIVVSLASGDTWSIRDRFAGTTRKELGQRIAHVRRRALHGLLRRS